MCQHREYMSWFTSTPVFLAEMKTLGGTAMLLVLMHEAFRLLGADSSAVERSSCQSVVWRFGPKILVGESVNYCICHGAGPVLLTMPRYYYEVVDFARPA